MSGVAELAARARLDTHASQRTFRALLDALARPGRVGALELRAPVPPALLPALALADVDVTTCLLTRRGEDTDWQAVLTTATGAVAAELEEADIVVALRAPTPDEVRSLRRGRADAPELGACLTLAFRRLGAGLWLGLRGPGVPGAERLLVEGLEPEVFEALAAANRRFPAGVDAFVVAEDGAVAGLPRSTDLTVGES